MSYIVLPSKVFENPKRATPCFNGHDLNRLDQQHFLARNLLYAVNSWTDVQREVNHYNYYWITENFETYATTADRVTPFGRGMGGENEADRMNILRGARPKEMDWSIFVCVYGEMPREVSSYDDATVVFTSKGITLWWNSTDGPLNFYLLSAWNQLYEGGALTTDEKVDAGIHNDYQRPGLTTVAITFYDYRWDNPTFAGTTARIYVNGQQYRQMNVGTYYYFDELLNSTVQRLPSVIGGHFADRNPNTVVTTNRYMDKSTNDTVMCYYEWNRTLDDAEIVYLHNNPFILMRN